MDLICSSCFTHPVAAAHHNDPSGTVVCALGRISLPAGFVEPEPLRCDYCGRPMHLDRHHTAWYGIERSAA